MDTQKIIDSIIENMFYALPVLHKRIMKINPPDADCGIHLSRIHFGILAVLHDNKSPVTEIANVFLISKPQMTFIMNQMVEAGLIERTTNPDDRRIKDTVLTARGEDMFRRMDDYIKHNIKKMFAGLTKKELEELDASLRVLRKIGARLDIKEK